MPSYETLTKTLNDPDKLALLAHVFGGAGENLQAGNPMFSGVPQGLVQAHNYARLLNALKGDKKVEGTATPASPSTTGATTDNNPNTPPQRMKLSMDGVPTDLTQALTNMAFGGYSANEAGIGGGVRVPSYPPLKPGDASIPYGGPRKEDYLSTALAGAPPF